MILRIFFSLILLFQVQSLSANTSALETILNVPFGENPTNVLKYISSAHFNYMVGDGEDYELSVDTSSTYSHMFFEITIPNLRNSKDTLSDLTLFFFNNKLYKVELLFVPYSSQNLFWSFKRKLNKDQLNVLFGKEKVVRNKIKEAHITNIFEWKKTDITVNQIVYDWSFYPDKYIINSNDLTNEVTTFLSSNVKLVVNIEKDIYKTVTNKKEIAEMGAGGVFEKLYKKQKSQLMDNDTYDIFQARILSTIFSGKNDTVSFKIIEKSTGNIVYQLDSILINGNYEIPGSDLNDAISEHTTNSGKCSTWEQNYHCDLVILIYKGNKVIIKKPFSIYPTIG